ncbi:class I SAM-dependent methyltransferase [Hoyosella rhizosphaerae]|uniref:Type 11 methyltransferase n=1 Tax=Hoyosella rhizosphaerae TaxID=1755582 RepID=A0A916UDZ3_9ACTN|nr:class I SAM-dependent methyltransferase [Hoyosella rhizosphaerae]MBN4925612.1 class I SAM-dependent methyltransferase [Hoyosella rhizosphaerae]GGC69266.1 type 11 methyltransferase [Hoyosella rhizosphaerae]
MANPGLTGAHRFPAPCSHVHSVNQWIFAQWFPAVMGLSELGGLRVERARLVSQAQGCTLEIGAGNGYNVPHYTPMVTELVLTDANTHMLKRLRRTAAVKSPPVPTVRITQADAQALPFPDGSFDTVVGTFVHCSVPNPQAALAEVARVLRPGGRYLFFEHVRAPDGSLLARIQDAVEPLHVLATAGCHPNRRTVELLRDSELTVRSLVRGRVPCAIATVRPTISGVAIL